jgi:excisionase family DNA binding protein
MIANPENLQHGSRFMTTKEAAKRTGYSADHLGLLLRTNIIGGKKIGRDWFIDESSLERYILTAPKPGRKRH